MKKLLCLFFVIFSVLTICAQSIYTKVKKYDKFDDVVWEKNVKTLITKTYDRIIIETKGQKPVEYGYYDNDLFAIHNGSRDSVVNLVNNVYGYEDMYDLFPKDSLDIMRNKVREACKNLPDSLVDADFIDANIKWELIRLSENTPTIVFRSISSSSVDFYYDTDLVWVRFRDGSRIIYSKR